MDNRIKILLPNERGVTSENVDLFLNIDLRRQFNEFKKDRFDNDFDLAAQFIKERNASRNFIVYGVLDSTVIDCVGLPIKVFRDADRIHEIATIYPTTIAYALPNVFGRRKGKYFLKLNNYKYDSVYFLIESNNFSYRDQKWEQRLVYYDADGNVMPYGTETVDINSEGDTASIENDFPFFFNKHWIKNDYNIIEEKRTKATFNVAVQQMNENEQGELLISLDKPSPFGLEMVKLNCLESSSFSDFFLGGTFNQVGNGNDIIIGAPQSLQQYANKMTFLAQAPPNKAGLISAGNQFRVLDGSYVGTYTVLYSSSIEIAPFTDIYQIILSADYNEFGTNGTPMSFRSGTVPDISFSIEDQLIDLPVNLSWQMGELTKVLRFSANTDLEVEFTEHVDLSLTDLLYCEPGAIMESQIIFTDTTPRRYASLFLGPSYENRAGFTGRTYSVLGNIQTTQTMPSYSILRNGQRYEHRNEEFYPSSGYRLNITNSGNRTLFPVNTDIGVQQETFFDIGETRSFYLPTKYVGGQRHSIRLTFRQVYGIPMNTEEVTLRYTLNGVNLFGHQNMTGYNYFKKCIDGNPYDTYNYFHLERPFEVLYNESGLTITLTSISPGVKMDFTTNDTTLTATTLINYFEKEQVDHAISLLANSQENTEASYSFSIEKEGFRTLVIPRQSLPANSVPIPYYLVTSYGAILRPYQDSIAQPYYGSASTIDDQSLQYWQINNTQPAYMNRGPAFINGVGLLADNILFNNRENLTTYGLGEDQFVAGFLPERLAPIVGTYETIVVQPSTKTIDLMIPYWQSITPPFIRSFDFRFGNLGNETVYRFGGNNYNLRHQAEWWWTHDVLILDEGGGTLSSASLQERLDTGDQDGLIGEGPVFGQIIAPTVIRFSSKVPGNDFYFDNIINYVDAGETGKIMTTTLAPNLVEGNYNLGNNGMGGFTVAL